MTLYMLRPPVDNFETSCRHLVYVSSSDQSVFVSVETFRAHSLFMMSQESNLLVRTLQHAVFLFLVASGQHRHRVRFTHQFSFGAACTDTSCRRGGDVWMSTWTVGEEVEEAGGSIASVRRRHHSQRGQNLSTIMTEERRQ